MSQETLIDLSRHLALQLAPDLNTSHAAAYIAREIKADSHSGSRKEWNEVEASIEGLSRIARVRVQDDLADALDRVLRTLQERKWKGEQSSDRNAPIRMSSLPDHLHLLLALSNPPTVKTLDFAHAHVHRPLDNGPSPDELLYQQIMSEPFSGSHWEKGYDEEVKRGWTDSESSSDSEGEVVTPTTGKLRSSVLDREELRRLKIEATRREGDERVKAAEATLKAFREESYWHSPAKPIGDFPSEVQGWKALTTRVSTIQLDGVISVEPPARIKVVSATVLQRELLFALSGRPGVFLTFDHDSTCRVIPDHPQVTQFSTTALEHILSDFSIRAGQAAKIRQFIPATARPLASSSRTAAKVYKTTQAFADACQEVLVEFETWIADVETQMVRGVIADASGTLPATPLALESDLDNRFGLILEHLPGFLTSANSPVTLLDELYSTMSSLPTTQAKLYETLMRIFIHSAEPIWRLLGDWLIHDETHGYLDNEKPLDPEFFIERDRDVSWTDEDFWDNGYVSSGHGLPVFLEDGIEELVLEAGKARGLLRAFEDRAEKQKWSSLDQVLQGGIDLDVRDISARVLDFVSPICRLTTFHLRRALQEDCGLDLHLDAIEGLCYMRGHEVINEWMVELFNKIQQKRQWSDFQTLTSSLRDIIGARGATWMIPSAIRIQATRSKVDESPLNALGRVKATYEAPFPLSQLFTSTSMELRSEVFALLLQLHYAHYTLLESRRIDQDASESSEDVKSVWQVRQQLLWFIQTLLSWLSRDVIASQTSQFREELDNTTSLKLMIALELDHARQIHGLACLHTKTQDLYEATMTILEMCLSLHRAYTAYMSDSTSPHNRTSKRRTNGNPRRRNEAISDDESENDVCEGEDLSAYLADEDLGSRMAKMRLKLNNTIMAFSEGVDRLAGEHGEEGMARTSGTWSVLLFALTDWHKFQPI